MPASRSSPLRCAPPSPSLDPVLSGCLAPVRLPCAGRQPAGGGGRVVRRPRGHAGRKVSGAWAAEVWRPMPVLPYTVSYTCILPWTELLPHRPQSHTPGHGTGPSRRPRARPWPSSPQAAVRLPGGRCTACRQGHPQPGLCAVAAAAQAGRDLPEALWQQVRARPPACPPRLLAPSVPHPRTCMLILCHGHGCARHGDVRSHRAGPLCGAWLTSLSLSVQAHGRA